MANNTLQEQIKSSINYIETLESKARGYLKEKQLGEDQLYTLKQREKSDRLSI